MDGAEVYLFGSTPHPFSIANVSGTNSLLGLRDFGLTAWRRFGR